MYGLVALVCLLCYWVCYMLMRSDDYAGIVRTMFAICAVVALPVISYLVWN